jgi:hypothetical protein
MNETRLVTLIKTEIARGDKASGEAERHYATAGKHLAALKAEHTGTWAEWETFLRETIGIGPSRASELMMLADGRKTFEQLRAETAARVRKVSERKRLSPLASGEPDDVRIPIPITGPSGGPQPTYNPLPLPDRADEPEPLFVAQHTARIDAEIDTLPPLAPDLRNALETLNRFASSGPAPQQFSGFDHRALDRIRRYVGELMNNLLLQRKLAEQRLKRTDADADAANVLPFTGAATSIKH